MADDNVSLITDPELLAEEQEEANSETNNSYTKKVKVFVASKSDIEGRISRYMQRHGMGIKSIQYIGSNTYAVVLENSFQQSVYVFDTVKEFEEKKKDTAWMMGINIGDVVYIVEPDSPDYWYAGEEHGGWIAMESVGYTQSQIDEMLKNPQDGDISLVNGKITHANKATVDGNAILQKITLDDWGHVKGYDVADKDDFEALGVLSEESVKNAFSGVSFLDASTGTTTQNIIEKLNLVIKKLQEIKA